METAKSDGGEGCLDIENEEHNVVRSSKMSLCGGVCVCVLFVFFCLFAFSIRVLFKLLFRETSWRLGNWLLR